MTEAWRLVKARYAESAFSGEGARLYGGRFNTPQSVKNIGDRWVRTARSLVLKVPSAVVPSESNYLINPNHPDFERLEITGPIDPLLDPRLM